MAGLSFGVRVTRILRLGMLDPVLPCSSTKRVGVSLPPRAGNKVVEVTWSHQLTSGLPARLCPPVPPGRHSALLRLRGSHLWRQDRKEHDLQQNGPSFLTSCGWPLLEVPCGAEDAKGVGRAGV